MFRRLPFLLIFTLFATAHAQTFVPPGEIAHINRLIASDQKNSLKCTISWWQPYLDFDFRFVAGFHLTARVSDLLKSEQVLVVIRVTPSIGDPVLLAQTTDVVPPPTRGSKTGSRLLQMRLSFGVGEGSYDIDAFVIDKKFDRYHRHWRVRTPKYDVRAAPLALDPLRVAAIDPDSWDGKVTPDGVRLTVLMDAAALAPNAAKLESSDRAFLLQALRSLLQRIPVQSVKLVAFNLDQQREVFRRDNLDSAGFDQLAKTLEELELNTVSVNALEQNSWLPFLLKLLAERAPAHSSPPSNAQEAVVFLGPNLRLDRSVTKGKLEPLIASGVRFFYLEYFAFHTPFPDSIERLTHELRGAIYRINTPAEFAAAVQKMTDQLRASTPDR